MQLSQQTVLITGGATGIGLALTARFLQAGSTVIAAGRREEALAAAREKFPALITRVADVATPGGRIALFEWASREFPGLNVLVNNAGIPRRVGLSEAEDWEHKSPKSPSICTRRFI